MNKEKLIDACSVLEKVIVDVANIYNSDEATPNQKALLETMIGAAIWYLPSSAELYSGYISVTAIEMVNGGTPISKLTQEHKFPRKQAGKKLLSETYKKFKNKEVQLYDLYINEFGKFNLVVKSENRDLIPFQGDLFIDDKTSYKDAGIELRKMSMEEIKNLLPKKNRQPTKGGDEAEQKDREIMEQPDTSLANKDKTEETAGQQKRPTNQDDGRGKAFTGITFNGELLQSNGNASKCYKAFMNYIIDNFEGQIENSVFIKNLVRPERNAPEFGTDPVKYPYVIMEHANFFYNVHSNSYVKKNRIITIANELGLKVEFNYQ